MKKTLVGLLAALLIASGGYFGFQAYVQHRVTSEVDAAFAQFRAAGGKATYGKLAYDSWNRTLTIKDIAGESAAQPAINTRIASLTASGVGSTSDNRFAADLVEVEGFEFSSEFAAPAVGRTTYKAPRIVAKQLSGPTRMEQPDAASTPLGLYRSLLAQFAAISASSVTAPTVSAKAEAGNATPGGAEFTYSNVTLEGIAGGKVAANRIDEISLTTTTLQAGKPDKITGRITAISSADLDTGAIAAMLDPQATKDDSVRRIYRQASIGTYEVTSAQGVRMRIEGVTIDDVGVRPSVVQLPDLVALVTSSGTAPSPTQMREVIEKVARLYEGLSVRNSRFQGLSLETPQGPVKLAAIQFNLDKGKGDFTFDDLTGRTPNGPFKVGRFALKSLDMPNLMRLSGQIIANPAMAASNDMRSALFRVMDGIEIKSVTVPIKDGRKQVSIETISASWDQMIDGIPSRTRLVAKMTAPLDASNPGLLPFLVAGIDKAMIDSEIGTAWSEAAGTYALDPFTLEVGELLKISGRMSLGNVPRGIFTADPLQAMKAAEQMEAGTLEISLRDLGAVDIFLAQHARTQAISREAARSALIEAIKGVAEKVAANPDAGQVADALVSFVTTPRQTLTVKFTPVGKVQAMQLIDLFKTDPVLASTKFRIEVQTGL